MDGHEAIENRIAPGAETDSSVYVLISAPIRRRSAR